jgi:hypothetical protein
MKERGTKGADEHNIKEEQEDTNSSEDAPLKIIHENTCTTSTSL